MAVIDFDTQILAATGQATLPLAYEYLEANYYSNGNDFSAGVITALKNEGLTPDDIGYILGEIQNHDDGGGGDSSDFDSKVIAAVSGASTIGEAMESLGREYYENDNSLKDNTKSALQAEGLQQSDIDDIIDEIIANPPSTDPNATDPNATDPNATDPDDNFDAMENYAIGAVKDYLEMQGLTDISKLDVAMESDDGAGTDTFKITADSYTYDSVSVTAGLDITWVFGGDGSLTTITDTGIETLGVPAITQDSIEMFYEYSNPDNNDKYAKTAVEDLFDSIGIESHDNLFASFEPVESSDDSNKEKLIIEVDSLTYGGQEIAAIGMTLNFTDGVITSKTGVPTELESAFSNATLNVWYEYSGPDQQRESDQQDGGYYDGDESHTETHSNFYTWEDWEGTVWTVVDKDVDGVWSSTQSGSNGDTRTNSSSWNDSTQTNTFTEVFTSESRGIDSTMVEASGPSGVTKTYTGTADNVGWMPLHEIYTSMDVVETLDQYWNTTDITGTAVNSDNATVTFTYADYELLIDGESIQADFGFDDMFNDAAGSNSYEWTDDWNNTIWVVVEENVNNVWTNTETAWSMDDNGDKDAPTGDVRTSFNDWNDTTKISTYSMHEVSADKGFDFTRVEIWNENTGLSSETITGTHDQIAWYFLGQTYTDINATVARDANWNVTSITGTVQDPASETPATLAVTFDGNNILIGGQSVDDMQDGHNSFQDGGSEWTWTDWDGTEWAVKDEEIDGVWTSTETNTGTGDVRSHTSEWDNATNTSTATESFVSGDGKLDFSRSEIWNEDGSWSETISGTTNQLGWMWLDGTYNDVNVTIDHGWDGMTLTGSGFNVGGDKVEFTINEHEELLIDGAFVDLGDNADFNMNEIQSWESSWEWADWDGTVWVVTDTQEGETWTSTEVQYTDDTKDTATGAERTHSSKWNERTQTNIWTDSEKSADGNNDFTRVETQRADGTSTEKITGKTDKFGSYDSVDITIARDSNWNIIEDLDIGLADGLTVSVDAGGNILIGGVGIGDSFKSDGGHANMESSESSWTWTDWDGVTWTVTDKQEGDTWTSTEAGSNGDVRIHKNSWNGDTETWSDTFTAADGSVDVTRVEVRNSSNNTSTETITGKDNHFGWWDFPTPYEGLDVTIERDANWNITALNGTADDGVTFAFANEGLTINGVDYQSGGDDRSNLMQEAFVNTWTWEDGNGVTWTVTDKQDGDTWTSTEEGTNGDVRINSSAWDSDVNDYVNTTSFKSGSDARDFSIRETWNADGTSSELIKGATDEINWTYLGEIYTDVDVTLVRNQNWETQSITGTGTDADGVTANFGWDAVDYQLSFNNVAIENTNYGAGGQQQESWESTWEWTDWDGTLWTVVESQVGDVWTSTETSASGAEREFKSSWDSVKQISIWSESYDEDASSTTDGGLDYTRVETYSPNGTSSETITGTTDNIAWYPLHDMYTNVSVTVERDASWNIYKVSGTGTNANGDNAEFGWSNDQITFGENNLQNTDDFKVNEDQYWENESTWEDWDGTTWTVTEIQDGETYSRTEINAERGDSREETNVWDHETQTNTRTTHDTNTERGIDVNQVSIWNSETETEITTITGSTDHIDWMPLEGVADVNITLTYDNFHSITAASGTLTLDGGVEQSLTAVDGQFLFWDTATETVADAAAMAVQWEDWDGSVWEMTQTQGGDNGNTWTRTETAISGNQEGAQRIESGTWDDETQTQTMTEKVTDSTANANAIISSVTRVQTFSEQGGSSEVITGSTNHIDWMQLGEIYTNVNLTITRDGDWNIQSIEGTGTNSSDVSVAIGFSPNENQLTIGGNLVAGDIGQSFENSWTWEDGDGVTWTVVDKQSGDTWTSTETGSNGDVRVMESTWDDANKTNTWLESFTNADKTIDYVKTEVYNETSGTSTMTTTGTSDHIGWMYVGETYTSMNIVETRGTDWNTTGLSGTATNASGDTVNFGWDDGEITLDGDVLSIHGPEDFSMSSDNFENEWTYYDNDGIEWTVVESQQNDAWISEETSEFGDVRVNSNYWDEATAESTHVTKFKSADGDIKYKMTETWANDGSSTLTVKGDTDHIGWDYVGQVFTDIDVVITRNENWEIQTVKNSDGEAAKAKNENNDVVTISFDSNNDITINGMSIYQLGDDFYKDFDQGMLDQLDNMQAGSWEYDFTNHDGHTIKVEEAGLITDILTIKTNALDITLIFDLGDDSAPGGPTITLLPNSKGMPDVPAFSSNSLETWYTSLIEGFSDDDLTIEEEVALFKSNVETYLAANSISDVGLIVGFDIADTFTTKETNQTTGEIFLRTRTENDGSETEREEAFASEAELTNNNSLWWNETVRSFEDSEYGFKETSLETSSMGMQVGDEWVGQNLTIVTNYAPDGTVSILATGVNVMGDGAEIFIMRDINLTSVLEDGWKYTDFFGTGTIVGGPDDGKKGVITSDGTDPDGGPLMKVTIDNADGTYTEMSMYEDADKRMGELHEMGNPLDRYIIQADYSVTADAAEGFASSKNFTWNQTSFDNESVNGTTTFLGENNAQTSTVEVIEVRTTDAGGMLEKIVQTVISTKGNNGESYTKTYTLNDNFDVKIVLAGSKEINGETYKDIDMTTEVNMSNDSWVEGTAKKLDGTNVDFFKGHHDENMEIMSISRDGTVHKVSEAKLVPDDNDHGPKNEIQQWQYTDHEGSLWTVLEKFDGNGMSSTETNAAGDSRTMKDTWSDDGSYSFEMSESIDGETYTETRSGTPSFSDGKYREVEAVVITENSVEIENYTQTLVFNDDFTATRTLIGTLEFMGKVYTDANVVIEQNENWQATAVSGNATNSDGDTATITMDGNHQWGDPKLVFTVDGTAINDTREVIGNKVADNIDPVAVDDSITINENQAFIVDVLSNDTDADVDGDGNPRDILSIKSIGAASNGEVNLAGGSLIYTPDYAYTGTDSFTYTVTDGKGGTDQGTVNITVDGVNEAPVAVNDIYTVKSGFGSIVLDLLANDTDADGDTVYFSTTEATSLPVQYLISNFNGLISFSLKDAYIDFTGTQSFDYYVTDGGLSSSASVEITIEALNTAPVAVADSISLTEDIDSVMINVLSNDTDAEGDLITVDSFTNPNYGTAMLLGGSIFYTPDANYVGADSFTYTIVDDKGASATETITLAVTEVNDAPVTTDDVLNIEEGSADGITVNLLSNDYDRESDAFTLTSVGTAENGAVVMNIDGTVTYTAVASYTGPDQFSYTVTDVQGAKSTGTVSITVSVINGAPVTTADVSTVAEDSSSNRISVLTNDTDPEDNTLTLDSVSAANNGTVSVAGNVALYTPDANFAGSDSFNYWVTDGEGGSTKGEVSITVTASNDAPTAVDDTLGSISATRPSTLDLMANDTDPDGDTLTISAVGDATYGNVTISGTSVRFNATRGSAGESDSFTYTITDADGETSTATANFTISANTNPNAINDKVTYAEDASAAEIEVLTNDTDSDGDSVAVLSINTDAEHGTVALTNGKIFYAPSANYNGTDSFTYIVKDGQGGRDEATVAITVTSVNDAPTLVNDTITVDQGSSANVVSVLDNDSDTDADSISITAITAALHGTATLTAGALTYTPESDYTGSDSFNYTVSDGTVESSATVNITVSAGNALPTITADSFTIIEDSNNQLVDVLANDSDTDSGDTLSVASVTQAEYGTVTLTGGSVFYTPDANFAGTDVFTYTANDGSGGTSSARVTMTVTGEDDAPTAVNDALASVEAGSGRIEIDLISNDSDVDGDIISIKSVGDALYGTTTFTAGAIYYQPGSAVQSDVFSYTIVDANDNESSAYASVDIIAANNAPTGAVTITGGTQPYQTLTASNTMADADGISDAGFSYQWYADSAVIDGATSSTYDLSLEDVGTSYSVKSSYTDTLGNAESKTSATTDAVTQLDKPFSFVASDNGDGTLTLTLKADVEAIYSRSDITGLTGADLNLNIDWSKFATLDGSDAKYSITTIASPIIVLESSSTDAADSFDSITLASLRLTPPLLTLVDTDATNDEAYDVGTSDNLISIILKPVDSTEKVSISLSGSVEANQGQVSFNQYDATVNNITGVAANSNPEGSVSVSGVVAVDEILTASHTITDADGMRAVSFQWMRDGADITDATSSTYTITTADVNKALSVKASYTDGGSTAETVTSSSSTVTQTDTNKPFMLVSELITAGEASIALYGADYSENSNEAILKLTLNGDITRFDTDNSSLYTSVAGAELDILLDWTKFEAIEYNDGTSETYEMSKDYEGKLFLGAITNDNGEFSKIVFSSLNTSTKPVLTLIDSVSTTGRGETDRPTEINLATIYLNPLDSADDVEITYGGIVATNQGDASYTQLSHSLEVVTKTYDAIISTAATESTITKLTDTSVNLWKDGADTGTSVAVDSGEISIANTVTFDTVKLSAANAYDFDINISDAIDVLRHIVDLEAFTANTASYQAADVDNNGAINISDAIDILRHIVDLDTIDTFDVLDSSGARVTELDADATGDAPTWTLVANGDVDMSGSFASDYAVQADIV